MSLQLEELAALIRVAASDARGTDAELYEAVRVWLLATSSGRRVPPLPGEVDALHKLVGDCVRGLRQLGAGRPGPNIGGCGSCPHPTHTVPCYCGCRVVSTVVALDEPRIAKIMDPHTGREYVATVEGRHPQPGEKVDVNLLVRQRGVLEDALQRIAAVCQAWEATTPSTLARDIRGVAEWALMQVAARPAPPQEFTVQTPCEGSGERVPYAGGGRARIYCPVCGAELLPRQVCARTDQVSGLSALVDAHVERGKP